MDDFTDNLSHGCHIRGPAFKRIYEQHRSRLCWIESRNNENDNRLYFKEEKNKKKK